MSKSLSVITPAGYFTCDNFFPCPFTFAQRLIIWLRSVILEAMKASVISIEHFVKLLIDSGVKARPHEGSL